MATLTADFAINVVLGVAVVAATIFIVLVVAMLAAIYGDPESDIDAEGPPLPKR